MKKLQLLCSALFVSIILMIAFSGFAKAETAAIWTDKTEYSPEETVIIYGSGFMADAAVTVSVTRPDATVNEWTVTSDSSGVFTTTYQLDGITGTYLVTATDGTNTATTTFEDGPLVYSPARYPAAGAQEVVQGGSISFTLSITADTADTYTSGVYADIVGYTGIPTNWFSFSPSSLTFTTVPATKTTTVTITVPSTAATGVYAKTTKFNPRSGTGVDFYIKVKAADTTPPLVSVLFPSPNGNNGWFKSSPITGTVTITDPSNVASVSVTGASVSGESGVGTTTYTATLTVSGDGTHSVSVTATDGVGNSGAVSGSTNTATIKIDATPPTITGAPTTSANTNGWYKTDVTVHFTASDSLSGLDTVTPDQILSDAGAGQSVTGTAIDKAGNSAFTTVGGINIDKTAPVVTITAPTEGGFYRTSTLPSLAYTITDNLDPNPSIVVSGWSTAEGVHTVTVTATDAAGNVGSASRDYIVDNTPPVVTASASPNPNAAGWHNTDVTVSFSAADALSGVATVDSPATVTTEGASQVITGYAIDLAGNVGSGSITLNIDKTSPTISGAATTSPNANGWYKTDVTVHFTASDGLSGIDTMTPDTTLTSEGQNQHVLGTAVDKAGNSATFDVTGINIDKTAPVVSLPADRGPDSNGWYNHLVSFTVTATDALSGVDTALTVTPSDYSSPDGSSITVTGSATDKAGNTASASLTFKYDSTIPSTSDNYDGLWHTSDFTITLTASDATSGVAQTCYKINDDATMTVSANGQPKITTESATNKLEYWSVDVAGNAETHHTLTTVKLDKTAPTTTLTIGKPQWGTDPINVILTTPFSLSATDATSGVATTQYSFDGTTSWTAYNGPFTASSIGSHTLYYRSIDNAGNLEPYKSEKIFVADLTVETGFKAGDSPSFASDPYLTEIMCVMVKATSGYKLAGTAPGTFDYTTAIKNNGTTTFTSIIITVYGDPDFNLQSTNPIRVLDTNGADISPQFTVTGTWPTITIQSKSTFSGLSASRSLYVTIHLDYKLKGQSGFQQFYARGYRFQMCIVGTSGADPGTLANDASVAFISKKTTVIYGFVRTSSGASIQGAKIELWQGSTLIKTDYTDADGFYSFIDGWEGVTLTGGAFYTVKCYSPPTDTSPFATQSVIVQKDKAVAANDLIK